MAAGCRSSKFKMLDLESVLLSSSKSRHSPIIATVKGFLLNVYKSAVICQVIRIGKWAARTEFSSERGYLVEIGLGYRIHWHHLFCAPFVWNVHGARTDHSKAVHQNPTNGDGAVSSSKQDIPSFTIVLCLYFHSFIGHIDCRRLENDIRAIGWCLSFCGGSGAVRYISVNRFAGAKRTLLQRNSPNYLWNCRASDNIILCSYYFQTIKPSLSSSTLNLLQAVKKRQIVALRNSLSEVISSTTPPSSPNEYTSGWVHQHRIILTCLSY